MIGNKFNKFLDDAKTKKNFYAIKTRYSSVSKRRISGEKEVYIREALSSHTVDEVILLLLIADLKQDECVFEMQKRRLFPSLSRRRVKGMLRYCRRLTSGKVQLQSGTLEEYEDLKRSLASPSISRDIKKCV